MAQSKKLLGDLLDIFETVLLPTYASHFVQFIIFYICSFHEVMALRLEVNFFFCFSFFS
jgi:hypothetical protein